MSSILYSSGRTVGEIEHYAITFIQIVAPSGEVLPQETGLCLGLCAEATADLDNNDGTTGDD
jgi:hypothetical protein